MPENENKIEKGLSEYWTDFLLKEFSKETDRAAIILTTSLFENVLSTLLKVYLIPTSSRDDELFDGPTAPLSNLSSKIQLACRLGLISQKFAKDLNVIRKIRNEFAHNVSGSTLESSEIKDLLTTLVCSSNIIKNNREVRKILFPKGSRGDFLMIATYMLFCLNQEIEEASKKQVKPILMEWVYSWIYPKDKLPKPPGSPKERADRDGSVGEPKTA